jgi:hypothetical protein
MLHIHACNHLGTRLSFSCYRPPSRNTRRTLALSVAGVDAVVGQMLFDEVGEAYTVICDFFLYFVYVFARTFASAQQPSLARHADDVVSVHHISRII